MGVLHLSWQTFKQTWKWTHFLQDKISSALTFYHSNILKLYFVEFCADPKSFFILSPIFSVLLSLHLEHRFSNPFPTFLLSPLYLYYPFNIFSPNAAPFPFLLSPFCLFSLFLQPWHLLLCFPPHFITLFSSPLNLFKFPCPATLSHFLFTLLCFFLLLVSSSTAHMRSFHTHTQIHSVFMPTPLSFISLWLFDVFMWKDNQTHTYRVPYVS